MKQVDYSFLRREEGFKLKGYVPRDRSGSVIGRSGVTIATGVDIGQRNKAEILALWIPDDLKRKLLPYAELRGANAVNALRFRPLTIKRSEAEQLDGAIQKQIVNRLEKLYNDTSAVSFECIPKEAQTVLASLAMNFGPNLNLKLPRTWGLAIRQDWKTLADLLFEFPTKNQALKDRRKREAMLLQKIK